MQEMLPLPDDARVASLAAIYRRVFPRRTGMEMALDFFEAGVIERDEALRIVGIQRRREFSQSIVARRRARRGSRG